MKRTLSGVAWIAAACAGILIAGAAANAQPANLVSNGDFSKASGEKPADWSISGDTRSVAQTLAVRRDADGKPFAELSCTRFEKSGPAAHAMLCQVGKVQLKKGRTYEFSCRMRQENIAGRSVSVAIQDTRTWKNAGLSAQFAVGEAWKTCRRVFNAAEDVGDTSRLQIWYTETGTLCIADVRIVEWKQEDVEFTHIVPAGSKNLVANGSFEAGAAGWSSMGQGIGWGDLPRLHGTVENGGAAHGRSFLRIAMGEGRTPMLYFDYYDPIARKELRPLAASLGWIRVEPGASYMLSCSMRASKPQTPAIVGVVCQNPAGGARPLQKDVILGPEWKRYDFSFKAQQKYLFVIAGPNLASDERVDVDLDAVQLEKGDAATEFAPHSEVEWSIEPEQAGGIFTEGQPARLMLRACNSSDERKALSIELAATDFDDRPVSLPQVQMSLAPKANTEKRVDLPADWRGFYRVHATAGADDRAHKALVRVAIVPRPAEGDSICGINHAFVSAEQIHAALKAGVTWYRDWSLKMQHIEPQRGQFRWELADAQIDRVLKQGARVLPMLPPFPSADWCSEAPASLPTRGYPWNRMRSAFAPKDPADLTNFIDLAVGRYKDRVHIWEFLNEPVYTNYALPADPTNEYGGRKYTAKDYVALLEKAAAAMRKADPGCKVMGGIAGWPRMLTKEVIDAGILKQVDLFNLHMYPGQRLPEAFLGDMDYLLKLMDDAGGRKPIWVTEFSYYAADDLLRKPFIPRLNSWSEERLLDSERRCADYTVRYFIVMLMRNVEKIFIHSGASGRVNQPDFECALFAEGIAPRKLFASLAVLNKVMGPRPVFAGERKIGKTGHCAAFETGASSVLAFWQTSEQAGPAIGLAAPSGAKWIDPVGRTLEAAPRLSSSPVYLVAPGGKAKELLSQVRE